MKAEALEILSNLISIPSENPGGNEHAITQYCAELLQSHGLRPEIVQSAVNRPNIICTVTRGSPGKHLIFQGHLDTKPAVHGGARDYDWVTDPFVPTVKNGMVYGLGACDTKGGVAGQLWAFIEMAKQDRFSGTLTFQGVADEENGSIFGAAFLTEHGRLECDAAVVAEPTSCEPTRVQLGNSWTEVEVHGLSAHSGTPWRGRDASEAALELIDAVKRRLRGLKQETDDFAPHPRVSVGIFEGGSHPGTICGRCRFVTDIRVRPGETPEFFRTIWQEEAKLLGTQRDLSFTIRPYAGGGCESSVTPADADIVKAAMVAFETEECNIRDDPFYGGSDARFFAKRSIPALVMGPGSLEQAHAPNEFVPIAEVEKCARLYLAIARSYLVN